VRTSFGPTSNDDNTVRAKIRPLLEGAAERNVAVLGIIHPLKRGSQDVFAGCEAFRRAARAAWRCVIDPAEGEPLEMRKRRLIIAAKVNNAPDDLRLAYRIEGVELPRGIASSRVVFQPAGRPISEAPVPSAAKQTISAAAARAWLAEQLAGGPRDSAELKAATAAAGVSIPALYRAAVSLGVQRVPVGGTQRKSWRLQGDAVGKQ
jgi:hypothetical protein